MKKSIAVILILFFVVIIGCERGDGADIQYTENNPPLADTDGDTLYGEPSSTDPLVWLNTKFYNDEEEGKPIQ